MFSKKFFITLALILALFTLTSCKNADKLLTDAAAHLEQNITKNVSTNFQLPDISKDYKGVTIEWSSSNTTIIANDGTFTQPNLDTDITISIKLKYKDKTLDKAITVKAIGKSEEVRLNLAKEALTLPSDNVNSNLTLPTSNPNLGATISWSSSNTSIISNTGQITKSKVNETVTLTATITVGSQSTTKQFNLTVNKLAINTIVLTKPTKLTYIYGEDLVLTDSLLTITYENNSTEIINLEASMISGYDKNKLGSQEVTVTYNNQTFKFTVTVNDAIASTTLTNPSKVEYEYGEELDLSGGLITFIYKSGDRVITNLETSMITGYNKNTLGSQEITVTYNSNTYKFNVTVIDKISATVLMHPTKLEYIYGENLDLTGSFLQINYISGTIETVNLELSMISGYNKNILGSQEITVTYNNNTYKFNVEVKNQLISTELLVPTDTTYFIGEDLDLTGGLIKKTFISGLIENINLTSSMVSGFDNSTLGTQTITVTFENNTYTYNITVIEEEVEFTSPIKLEYVYGNELDLTGGLFTITNYLGETEEVLLTIEMISGYNSNLLGNQTVIVSFNDVTYTYEITVIDDISNIEFIAPSKVNYLYNEELDLTDGNFKVTYLSGAIQYIDLEASMISNYDKTLSGVQDVNVTYENEVYTFNVIVASSTAVKLPTPFGIVARLTGLEWGSNDNIKQASGFRVYIEGYDNPIELPLVFNININSLGLPAGTYNIRIQAIGDNINFLNSDISTPVSYTVPYGNFNLALNATATATSGNPQLAIDGNAGTRWESAFNDDQNITFDLGSTKEISTVKINWEGAYGKEYIIQVSNDGTTWTDIYTELNSDGGIDIIQFDPVSVQFVRLQGIKRALPYGYSLWEFEIYSSFNPNLATGKTATATSGNAGNSIDGNLNSRWESQANDDQSLTIDLGSATSFNTVVLRWEGAYGKEYIIQVSTDGTTWTDVYTETNGNGTNDNLSFDSISAQYVRMKGVKRGTVYGYSLWEIEIYNIVN